MKQIVNTYSVARTFETKDNSVENIKKEIGKYIDEMANHVLGNPDNENFQISKLIIKRYDDKLESSSTGFVDGDDLGYTPELESYKKLEKRYCIKITANVIRNDPDQ